MKALRISLRRLLILEALVCIAIAVAVFIVRNASMGAQLIDAAARDDSKAAQSLLERGAPTDHTDAFGYGAVFYAVENENRELLEALLIAGADPNIAPEGTLTPLGQAVLLRDEHTVRKLVRFGADIRANAGKPNDCLQIATDVGDKAITRILRKAASRREDVHSKSGQPLNEPEQADSDPE